MECSLLILVPDRRDPPSENVLNLSVDPASLNTPNAASERGENQNQLAGDSKSESERSETPIKRNNRKGSRGKGWRPATPTTTDNESNPNKYKCPKCMFESSNPSKLTDHKEEFHKDVATW